MRDTSEFTDATEQAKKPNPRPRNNARSKPESTAPGSQDQEVKPAAPRRRTSPTNNHSTTGPRPQNGNDHNTTGPRPQNGNDHNTGSSNPNPPRSATYRSGGAPGGQHNVGPNTSLSGPNQAPQRNNYSGQGGGY